jgi:hypothetical protein
MYFTNINNFKSANGYEIDGIWYPRVTAIVSIKAKPALYKFYAGLPNFAAGEAIKTKSAEEGTLLHEIVEAIIAGKETAIPDPIRPAVSAFLDFKNQHEIIPHQVETRIVSKKHNYAGTLDVLAEVDGRLGVLDLKTSLAIYRDYGIQAAAYVEALKEQPSMPDLTRWILRIDQAKTCLRGCGSTLREKGGVPKIRTPGGKTSNCNHVWGEMNGQVEFKELPDLENDTRAFLAAKTLWEWENDYWLRQIDKLS